MSLPRPLVFSGALGLAACAGAPTDLPDDFGYEGTGIAFQIAPLTLETLKDACYSFAIENGEDAGSRELVVGRGPQAAAVHSEITGTAARSICASQFGNAGGGDISYVAPCDADRPSHLVTLWVDALCDSASAGTNPAGWNSASGLTQYERGNPICGTGSTQQIQNYVNPCGTAGCELNVTCAENADTPVSFNFTVMGQADQGFFDVAVNFDDVFCSAKLEDCYTTGDAINLVHDPVSKERIRTAVAAVACTAGPDKPGDDVTTHLNMSLFTITCGDGRTGTLNFTDVTSEGNLTLDDFPAAVYFGTERLPGANKVYTSVAIGIGTSTNCQVTWNVFPTNGPLPEFEWSNTWNSYGYVQFDGGDLGGATLEGTPSCHTHELNGDGSAVTTAYVDNQTEPDMADSEGPLFALAQDIDAFSANFDDSSSLPPLSGFAAIQAGTFTMGSPDGASPYPIGSGLTPPAELGRQSVEDPHQVTLTRAFWMQTTEVTQGQWKTLSGGVNPSCFQEITGPDCSTSNANDLGPVEQVDWYSALAYANALSVSQGLQACYTLSGCTDPTTGWQDGVHSGCTGATFVGLDCTGYRLPTEAEWEYAARAGTTTATYAGNLTTTSCDDTTLPPIAWFCGNAYYRTQAVGGKTANAWGLYDMLGNVWEWTWDRYGAYGGAATDPLGPATGEGRVRRGGGWNNQAWNARAASRNVAPPDYLRDRIGLRLVRSIP